MNVFVSVVLYLAVTSISAEYSGYHNQGVHESSGVVPTNHDGSLIVGPSGSGHTDNGVHGHGAESKVEGPSGSVAALGRLPHIAGLGENYELNIDGYGKSGYNNYGYNNGYNGYGNYGYNNGYNGYGNYGYNNGYNGYGNNGYGYYGYGSQYGPGGTYYGAYGPHHGGAGVGPYAYGNNHGAWGLPPVHQQWGYNGVPGAQNWGHYQGGAYGQHGW